MTLAPCDYERAIERAPPANLDRVAEHFRARRFADDAMIEPLAFVAQSLAGMALRFGIKF
jgi:hypothetical protein